MAAKSLEKLLNPSKDGDLASIVRHAQDMGQLAGALAAAVSPEEGASILAANVRDDGELVVLCRSPAWASRLRFSADALIAVDKARSRGLALQRSRRARGHLISGSSI